MSTSDSATMTPAAPQMRSRRVITPPAWLRRLLGILMAWSGTWWLLLGALLAPVVPGHWWTLVLAAALLGVVPLLFLSRALTGTYPSKLVRLLVFRPFWYAQLMVPLIASAGVLSFLVGAPFGMAQRSGRTAALVVLTIGAAGALTGYLGSRRLRVVKLAARFRDLPAGLEGMRIAQVSDLHVGPHTPRRHLRRILAAVQDARPDLIAITGDQVDDYPRDVEPFARAFRGFTAPLGVFAIAGNHDVYAGWPDVRAGLEEMGVTVLVNDSRRLERGGDQFWLVGTGDPAGSGRPLAAGGDAAPDIARTLSRVPPGAFTIALAHNPALWPQLADRGVRLTLSGHTHYGQISIPRLRWSVASMFLEYAMGAYRRGRSLLYINPGTNYWGLPLRIGALPEVTIITLRNAAGGEERIAA